MKVIEEAVCMKSVSSGKVLSSLKEAIFMDEEYEGHRGGNTCERQKDLALTFEKYL